MKDEKCLLPIQNNKFSYEELLEKGGSVSVHHRNIQSFAIEMLQIKHGHSREIKIDIFTQVTRVRFKQVNVWKVLTLLILLFINLQLILLNGIFLQKQPARGVPRKKCCEIM